MLDRSRALAGAAPVLDFSGHYRYRCKEFDAVLADFREALEINEKLGDQRGIALQSQFCGRTLGGLTRYDETVRAYLRSACQKLGFHTGHDAVTAARRHGLLIGLVVAIGQPSISGMRGP